MKYRVKDLKEVMKENGIKGGSMRVKQELIYIFRKNSCCLNHWQENQLNHSRNVQNKKKFQDL